MAMSEREKGKSTALSLSKGEQEKEARWQRLRDHLAGPDPAGMPDDLLHLARAMAGVDDPNMTCEACQSWLPSYVDAEIGGLPAAQEYPQVKRHLDLCADCEAEYVEMLELALAEDAGELPMPEHFPTPNLGFLPPIPLPVIVRDWAEELIAAIAPHLVDEFRIIADVFFERIAALGEGFRLQAGLAPALGLGDSEVTGSLQMLAATYVATQVVVTDLSAHAIEEQAQTGRLSQTLRRQAEQAARDMNLSSEEAQAFAEQYAELVCQNPEVLQELATR
jgi:hypothetical protein